MTQKSVILFQSSFSGIHSVTRFALQNLKRFNHRDSIHFSFKFIYFKNLWQDDSNNPPTIGRQTLV